MEKIYLWTLAFILLTIYFEVESFPNSLARLEHNRKKTCGEALTNALQSLCTTFNPMYPMYRKRSQEEEQNDYYTADEGSIYPFRSRKLAKALIPGTFRRDTRGIVEECCRKSCTPDEMYSYCGNV